MTAITRIQTGLEGLGGVVSSVLLFKFALDFSVQPLPLSVPFWTLVICAVGLLAYNAASPGKKGVDAELRPVYRAALLLIVPAGFFAASLGCTGLAPFGCTPFCTFIKLVWVPAVGIAALVYSFRPSPRILLLITAMCFVPLYPHCVCSNAANEWWIERFGTSGECYVWGFTCGLIVLTAVRKQCAVRASLSVSGMIVTGSMAFFVGHHYFKFPW
ncbi:MAG TPA: hypothetical protein VEZ90_00095 [Blastocatellia bacterium]|nr:hypothetical protein [Blastocatellia bacterium]